MTIFDEARAAFEADNRRLEPRLSALFADLTAQPALNGRLLNTLSLMEHAGSRRIMRSRAAMAMDRSTLKHLAEETRHAFFMKRVAEVETGRPLGYESDEILAGAAARAYFGRLDVAISRGLSRPSVANYLLMSLIVEFRATWGYRLYDVALRRAGRNFTVRSLLAEEKLHLAEMSERLADSPIQEAQLQGFMAVEAAGFARLLEGLERAAQTAPVPA